jgi:hypothetical protein
MRVSSRHGLQGAWNMRSGSGAFVVFKKGSTAAMFDSSSGYIAGYSAASSLDRQIQRTSLQENISMPRTPNFVGCGNVYWAQVFFWARHRPHMRRGTGSGRSHLR